MFKTKSKVRFVPAGRAIGKMVEPHLIRVGDVVQATNIPHYGIPNSKTRTMLIIDISLSLSGSGIVSFIGKTATGGNAFVDNKRYAFRLLQERAVRS